MADTVRERIELCQSCDQLNSLRFCKLCGCFMPAKVRLKGSSCPQNKWLPIIDYTGPAYTGLPPHEEHKLKHGIVDNNN